jgi:hypothetical protein
LAGFFFCVGFPALVTAIAPISWVRLTRSEDRVHARAQTCLLFVFPYNTQTLNDVIGVGDRFVRGERIRRQSRETNNRTEDQAFLVLHGGDRDVEVSISPVNVESAQRRVEEFLADSAQPNLRLIAVANWKFSIIAGGLISLLTLLYAVGVVASILLGVHRLLRPADGTRAAS